MRIELTEADLRYDPAAQAEAVRKFRGPTTPPQPIVFIPKAIPAGRPRHPSDRRIYAHPINMEITRRPDATGRKIYAVPCGPALKRDVLEVATTPDLPFSPVEPTRSPLRTILREVAIKHGKTVLDLRSDRRSRDLVLARFEFSFRARNETVASLPEIGRALGGKDHSSILHGIRRYTAMLEYGEVRL